MSPFTEDVLRSLQLLRRAITDVVSIDAALGETLTAVTDDLVHHLEGQMLLLFCNFGAKKKEDELALLRGTTDQALSDFYASIKSSRNGLEADATAAADSGNSGHHHHQRAPALTAGGAAGVSPSSAGDAAAADSQPSVAAATHATPEVIAKRVCMSTLYLVTEATAHQLQAERASIYLLQRGTGSLRVVTAAPDIGVVKRGAFVAAHQGLVGSVFSTGVAIRADAIDDETRKNYVTMVDGSLGWRTHNTIVFPIRDPATNAPIGVFEASNKAHGAAWTQWDEACVYHVCATLCYVLNHYDVDWHSGSATMTFSPAPLHALRPYRPAARSVELDVHIGAADLKHMQLVARMTKATKAEVPSAVRGKAAQSSVDTEVLTMLNVKEMKSFLDKLEEAHRSMMNDLVQLQERESTSRLDAQKKAMRIRVLEENVATLHAHLVKAKQQLMQQSFSQVADLNASDYGLSRSQFDAAPQKQLGSFLGSPSPSGGGAAASSSLPAIQRGAREDGTSVLAGGAARGAPQGSNRPSPVAALTTSTSHVSPAALVENQQLARISQAITAMKAAVMEDQAAVFKVRQDRMGRGPMGPAVATTAPPRLGGLHRPSATTPSPYMFGGPRR